MTTKTVQERVQAGVEFLDAEIPDWRDRVSLPKFDIINGCACVLGQVFADRVDDVDDSGFSWAEDMFGYEIDWASDHGFDATGGYNGDRLPDYLALQAEWVKRINECR